MAKGEFVAAAAACAAPRIVPHTALCAPADTSAGIGYVAHPDIATENIWDLKQLSLVCFSDSLAVRGQKPTGQNARGCHL